MNTVLSAERVEAVFLDCLFKEGEETSNHVAVYGIMMNVGFNPDRLDSHKAEIMTLLSELPNDFQKSAGGGMSFLSACTDKHGHQWTGLQLRMEQLFLLGIAIGKVETLLPREIWSFLPGGRPYYAIN